MLKKASGRKDDDSFGVNKGKGYNTVNRREKRVGDKRKVDKALGITYHTGKPLPFGSYNARTQMCVVSISNLFLYLCGFNPAQFQYNSY